MKKILLSKATFIVTAFFTALFIFFFYWTFLKLDSVGLDFLDKVGVYILIYLYFPVFWVSNTMLSGLSENAALMMTVFLLPLLWSYVLAVGLVLVLGKIREATGKKGRIKASKKIPRG